MSIVYYDFVPANIILAGTKSAQDSQFQYLAVISVDIVTADIYKCRSWPRTINFS